MKAAIVGAGGVGRAIAAFLVRGGHTVTLVFRSEDDARRVASSGLRVTGVDTFDASPDCRSGALIGSYDVVVIATKTYDTPMALDQIEHIDFGVVLSGQNGVHKDDLLSARAPGRVIGAVVQVTASRTPVSGVHLAAVEPSFIGELDGAMSERTEAIARELSAAGLPTTAVGNIKSLEWTKLVSWIPSSLLSVVTRLSLPAIYEDPELARTYIDIAREVARTAAALGHEVVDEGELAAARLVADDVAAGSSLRRMAATLRVGSADDYRSSMLLDLLARRPLELEDTAGHLLEIAARCGVDVPVTRTLVRLARGVASAGSSLC